MERLSMCRICLTEDVRMILIAESHLQVMYEKLAMMPLTTEDSKPTQVCYICCARLQNCYQLQLNCQQSEQLLALMLCSDTLKLDKFQSMTNAPRLAITPVTQLCLLDECGSTEEEVKIEAVKTEVSEGPCGPIHDVKLEESGIEYEPIQENEMDLPDLLSSDSEDNVPLKVIKNKSLRRGRRKKKVKKEKPEDFKTSLKVDAHEIILSKDEQLANLEARSKSLNYTLSPYKCDLCYKGFVDERAFDNHREKHDERSGAHACEICRMRYRSPRLLRTHHVTAHSRLFQCNKCSHTSHTANQARVHEKWHSGFQYDCQLCGHKFRKPTSYLSHMRNRHPTEHICDICGECFVGKHGLQMHKSKSHRNEPTLEETEEPAIDRFCSECDIQFYSKDAWKRHILCSIKHTLKNETRSSCQICEWRGDSSALGTHLRTHVKQLGRMRTSHIRTNLRTGSTVSRSTCTQCGSTFVNRSKLEAHINRIHLGLKYNKNIVCEVCGKHCTSNATLKYHQRTHTGERPYSCEQCSKRFPDSNQLRIHTRIHTGERPYVCTACGKSFSQKPALNRHYRVHTGDKPYSCQYCSRTFSQSNSLKLHVRTVHLKIPSNSRKKLPSNATQDDGEKTEQKVEVIAQAQEAVA